jgi:glycosidase
MIDAEFFNGISYDFNSSSPDFNILTDPYSPESLKRANRQLWNKPNFPTLNQDKKLVRKILVQQLIWWIETTGLKNLKIEQAGRNNPELIKELYRHLSKDYSDLTVIIDNPSYNNQHFYWKNLTMEIPTYIVNYNYTQVLSNAFSPYEETKSSTKSLYNLQLQIEPSQLLSNINQLDNHLLNRAYTNADNDQTQLTMMLVHLMFTSGLPSIYYGTEWQLTGLLSKGISNLAKDFPGGWKNDETSGFSGKGMSEVQKQQYRLITKLLNWRKNNSDLFKGEFMHLILQNDVYAFIRQNNDQAILVIINNSNNSAYRLNEENYIGVFSQYSKFTEMLSDDVYLNFEDIVVREKSIAILTLDK